jgi:hypothetical protein
MRGHVLGTIALLFVVCSSAHGVQPPYDQDGSPVQARSFMSPSDAVAGGAAIGSETTLRIAGDRSTGQQEVRRSIGRLLRPGATSILDVTRSPRPAGQHARFPASSSLIQAGLPAWSTATPPPTFQR